MSDYVFIYWDDLGDSQEHVDNQCSCDGWRKEIQQVELGGCCNHAKQQDFIKNGADIYAIDAGCKGDLFSEEETYQGSLFYPADGKVDTDCSTLDWSE